VINSTTQEEKETTRRVSSRQVHRVQVDLRKHALEELDELRRDAGLSRAEAIRYGLKLLKWVIQQLTEGKEVLTKDKDGKFKVVEFFLHPLK